MTSASRPVSDSGLDDLVLPFAVEPLDVRGRLVRLGLSIDQILSRHAYPPSVARLLVQRPVGVGNMVRVENAVLVFEGVAFGKLGADKFGIDGAVDDGVGHVDAQRPELAGHALGQGAQGHLGP